jgi:hypothetical protein
MTEINPTCQTTLDAELADWNRRSCLEQFMALMGFRPDNGDIAAE